MFSLGIMPQTGNYHRIRQNKMAQAWIIGGPEGIGKATLAWRLARFLSAYPDSSVEAVQNAQSLEKLHRSILSPD